MEVQDLEKLVNQRSQSISSAMPALMRKVYTWMTLALAITGICAYPNWNRKHPLVYRLCR